MYGTITKFHKTIGLGVIQGDDGRKYLFKANSVRNGRSGLVGQDVNFVAHSSRSTDIIVLAGSPWMAFGN